MIKYTLPLLCLIVLSSALYYPKYKVTVTNLGNRTFPGNGIDMSTGMMRISNYNDPQETFWVDLRSQLIYSEKHNNCIVTDFRSTRISVATTWNTLNINSYVYNADVHNGIAQVTIQGNPGKIELDDQGLVRSVYMNGDLFLGEFIYNVDDSFFAPPGGCVPQHQ
eukprot:TRINITY_DN5998_c0_g1_i2.p1 TRINITY_DN5998_c0_g1~~TRINITY_DN5998_c0_g1_i2.p1  ORF type:complete len:165 (+),score=19.12 TRINITY_DN5998_c0_g1_i2:598-1092(+)